MERDRESGLGGEREREREKDYAHNSSMCASPVTVERHMWHPHPIHK